MKYAIIRQDNGELQTIFEAANDEPFVWAGEGDYKVVAALDFDIDLRDYDYADYNWNEETQKFETELPTIQEREKQARRAEIAAALAEEEENQA